MGYKDLTEAFSAVRRQHNIMAIVGNGFDIQALSDLKSPADTRYVSFFHYLKYRHFDDGNSILKEMESLQHSGAEDWSDVEAAIGNLVGKRGTSLQVVTRDLKAVQTEFSSFLDGVSTPEVLSQLGSLSVANEWAMSSFTEFLGDIRDPDDYSRMDFPVRLDIGDVFNFQFINLNYTTLLDDYVYLDQVQFDPHPFVHSDRNMNFWPNPRGHAPAKEKKNFRMVSYLVSDVVHPHGVQYVPRSLLFGIDSADAYASKLTKPYWAQNEVKYGDLFNETELFIIFGCSLGATDRWWWRSIAKALAERDEAELLLYWRRSPRDTQLDESAVRSKFSDAVGPGVHPDLATVLEQKARVVLYDDGSERRWLNTSTGPGADDADR
ncbi:AbiH family protein [Demequina capsici]|uniref:AbiH family protein n=1 Tax=Demequina capsici TaxID=3075620 RepID=A0AA96JCD0_9MICO|nr:AbiH family protein [Demequina sp. OYTSA14]WNM23519.1 AbiH family protein [Demequina sp. OYTSA14]